MKHIIYIVGILFLLNVYFLFAEETNSSTNSASVSFVEEKKEAAEKPKEEKITPAASETKPASATENAEDNEPIPYPQASAKPAPEEEKKKTEKKTEEKDKTPKKPPQKYGDCTGESWVGQRIVSERHAGWGWLKKDGESWKSAKWIMLEEKPWNIKGPQRFYNRPEDDHNMQYRIYGHFANYKGYEPNMDSLVDVFALKGFEVIGSGAKIDRKPPGPTGSRKGRISERSAF